MMKRFLLLLASAVLILGTLESCNKCRGVDCENGGTCNDGDCDCLKGFEGENCEIKDLCVLNDVICVFGECTEGVCNCNEGIELADCSREAREKFIGKFNVTEEVEGLDTADAQITIEKDLLNVPDMTIANLFNFNQFPVIGFFSRIRAVARENTRQFNIPRQAPDDNDREIEGFGSITYSPDSTIISIDIQYTITNGNQEFNGIVDGILTQ